MIRVAGPVNRQIGSRAATHYPNPSYSSPVNGQTRAHIRIGQHVSIVQKHHQATGELTEGIVQRILTKSPTHPHGIKVKLSSGEVGRVKELHD